MYLWLHRNFRIIVLVIWKISWVLDCCCLVTRSCPTLCHPMGYSMPGFPVLHYLPEFAQVHVHWVGDVTNHLILCDSLLLWPSTFPSLGVFSNELALHIRWPKCWSFSFSISPSNEYSVLIFFRIDWFDLAVQGTLKSLLQYHHSKASIPWHSAFFMVQLSIPYVTTGKAIALTIRTFVSKWCLCFLICCLGFSWLSFQKASIV